MAVRLHALPRYGHTMVGCSVGEEVLVLKHCYDTVVEFSCGEIQMAVSPNALPRYCHTMGGCSVGRGGIGADTLL